LYRKACRAHSFCTACKVKSANAALSIFLDFLLPKLPAPKEEDLSKGVLDTIDMESYRVEKQAVLKLSMENADATLKPLSPDPVGGQTEADIDVLSNILKTFNERFGNIKWHDGDKIRRFITEELPARIAQDASYQYAQASGDRANAKIEHDRIAGKVLDDSVTDQVELYRHYSDNDSFRRFLLETSFDLSWKLAAAVPHHASVAAR